MPSKRNQPKSQNDFKTLKLRYKQYLSSLVELFPNWSQEDLLFVMDECQGDFDLAINRISEGHASQWGQVKTKKTKPVQKKPNKGEKKKSTKLGINIHVFFMIDVRSQKLKGKSCKFFVCIVYCGAYFFFLFAVSQTK